MKTHIYRYELRRRLRSVLYWSLGILAVNLLYMAFYVPFAEQAALINQALADFPPAFRAAFGLGETDLSTVLGFYTLIFLMVQLMFAVQAGNYGVGLLSQEESQFTADFLLTKPVSRGEVVVSKYLAGLTALLLTNAAAWVSAFASIEAFRQGHPYDPGTLALMLGSAVIFQCFFYHVGLALSQMVRRVRNVLPYSLGLGFGMYVLSALSDIGEEVKLEWISPFKHFSPTYIVNHQALEMRFVWLNLGISLLALAFAVWRYLRRDILGVG